MDTDAKRAIAETVNTKTYVNFEHPNILLITGEETLPKNKSKTNKTDYKRNEGWKDRGKEGTRQKEWRVRVSRRRQKNNGRRERITETSNVANAERNTTHLELPSYVKIKFSCHKNKFKFGCY